PFPRRARVRREASPKPAGLPEAVPRRPSLRRERRRRAPAPRYPRRGRSSRFMLARNEMATNVKDAGVPTGPPARARETPMLRQYSAMKSRVPDAILFYRMGDFYEMFFEDAKEAAPLLGIALTARHRDSDIEAPMCGVPHHAADHHIAKLVAAGRKVAVC